jgi:hypothetical protein
MAKKQLTISIPTPYTEDWNAMTPDKNGKFCASCQKTVVDFTRMSDAEIFRYFDTFKGNACGRFSEKQLSAPIIEPLVLKPNNRWAWALSALLLPSVAASQTVKMNEATEIMTPSVASIPRNDNETISVIGTDFLIIEGEVRELGGDFLPVDAAIVAVSINDKIVAYGQSNALGIFLINLPKTYENQAFSLDVSQLGFEKEQLPFENFAAIKDKRLFISLKNAPIDLGEGTFCVRSHVEMTKKGAIGYVIHYNFLQRTKYRIRNFFRRLRGN